MITVAVNLSCQLKKEMQLAEMLKTALISNCLLCSISDSGKKEYKLSMQFNHLRSLRLWLHTYRWRDWCICSFQILWWCHVFGYSRFHWTDIKSGLEQWIANTVWSIKRYSYHFELKAVQVCMLLMLEYNETVYMFNILVQCVIFSRKVS